MSEEQTPQEEAAPETPSTEAAAPDDGAAPSSDDRTMAMLAHLLGLFTWFVGALIIWMIKRESSPFIDDQGKEALNFQITIGIGYIISAVTALMCVGVVLGSALYILNLVFCIMAAISAQKGDRYRYPFCWRLIK